MKCDFHPSKKAVKKARPICLQFWTPICRSCDRELGAYWGRVPLSHKGLRFDAAGDSSAPQEKP